MRAAIRRFGYATATGTAALGTAWLYSQAKDARGPPHALKPQQLLQSSLISKHWVSGDTVRLRFALPSSEHVLGLPVPGHLVVVDAATNYRPYSPITIDSKAVGFFELLVRKYPRGEFSSQLARMEPGDQATFAGPLASRFEYHRGAARHLGLIAAGTGITPMWQIIQAALDDPEDQTRLSLVYASRSPEQIMLREELDRAALAHPDRLQVRYIVSSAGSTDGDVVGTDGRVTVPDLPVGVCLGRIDAGVLQKEMVEREASHILVCGPESMVRELCGPVARDGGFNERFIAGAPPETPQSDGQTTRETPHGHARERGGVLAMLGYRPEQISWL